MAVFGGFSDLTPKPEVYAENDLYHVTAFLKTRPAPPPRTFSELGKKSYEFLNIGKIDFFEKMAESHRGVNGEVALIGLIGDGSSRLIHRWNRLFGG